jgi:DNA repair protein RadC
MAEFSQIKGFGQAKYVQLQAAVELSRRALLETLSERPLLDHPAAVADYLRLTLAPEASEVFLVLYLNAQNRLLVSEVAFRGTLTQTSVYPREIVKRALANNAAGVMFAHNHPSGNPKPSHADLRLTATLTAALATVEVKVLDHFIVTDACVSSLANLGLL